MKEFFNSNGAFAFSDDVPNPGPELFIKRLDANEKVCAVICGAKLRGIWIHWNAKRNKSEPHFREEQKCPGCLNAMPKRWKGFLHVLVLPKGEEMFLELTPESASTLETILGKETSWRFNRIEMSRGRSRAARVTVTVLTRVDEKTPLPPERDPSGSILKLWGYSLGDDGHWHEHGAGSSAAAG